MSYSDNQGNSGTTRRDFLRNAAASAAVTAAAAGVAKSEVYSLAPSRVLGANDKILIGHIGTGGQGRAHVKLLSENSGPDSAGVDKNGNKRQSLNNNTQSIAICDLYVRNQRRAAELIRNTLKQDIAEKMQMLEYKKLLEIKDVDAVWIATSDNWHAPIAIDALNAGKHVYVEKPMCKTMEEAFGIYDAVKKTGRVLQVGSQGCTDPKWHAAGKMVKEGRIGKTVMAQGSYCRNSTTGEWNYYKIDEDAGPNATGEAYIDWNTFRRGTEPAAWDPDRFFRWRKYYAYGNGIMGDLFPHRLHPLMIAMALPQTGLDGFPSRVSSMGGIYGRKEHPTFKGHIDREVPDLTTLVVDFPEGPTMMLLGSTVNEQGLQDVIRGTKGTLYIGGDTVEAKPEKAYVDEVEGGIERAPGGEPIENHEKNFLDCIRNGKTPNANIELAVRVQTMISLGDMAYQKGKTLHFDPKTRKVTG